jgi:hypothetical protein
MMIISKNVLKIIKVTTIILLSTWNLFFGKEFIFSQNVNNNMVDVFECNLILRILSALLLIFVILKKLRLKKRIKLFMICMIFTNWILVNRTISIQLYPISEINSGWFFMVNQKLPICSKKLNCEEIIYSGTKFRKLPLFIVNMKNKQYDHNIFVGPYLWLDFESYINSLILDRVKL